MYKYLFKDRQRFFSNYFCIFTNQYVFFTISAAAVKSNRPEVNIADQIAIRSFVLGQSLGKTGERAE